jgi:hypothetical protein
MENEGLLIEGISVTTNFFYFRNTNIQLFSGDSKFFHIKLADGYPMEKEFEAINQAWRLYPEFAPKPISLIEIDASTFPFWKASNMKRSPPRI